MAISREWLNKLYIFLEIRKWLKRMKYTYIY